MEVFTKSTKFKKSKRLVLNYTVTNMYPRVLAVHIFPSFVV